MANQLNLLKINFYIFEKKSKLNKRIFHFLILFFFFLGCKNNNNNNKVDSKNLIEDQNYIKLDTLNKIVKLDSASNELLESKDSNSNSLLYKYSGEYSKLLENEKSINLSYKLLNKSIRNKDSLYIAKAYMIIANRLLSTKKDSSFYYYIQAEKVCKKTKNIKQLYRVLYNKAVLLFYQGNYSASENAVSEALKCLLIENDVEYRYLCLSLQGSNHTELEEYTLAYKYFDLARETLNDIKNDEIAETDLFDYKINNILDICNVYDKLNQYNKSVIEYKKILTPELKKKNLKYYGIILGNYAYSKMKSGDTINVEAEIKESISILENLNQEQSIMYKTIDLGEFYLTKKDTPKAISEFYKGYKLSKEYKNGKELMKVISFLSKSDKTNYKYYSTIYNFTQDSIFKMQRLNFNKYARIEYETSKVENENKVLTKKNLFLLISSIGIGFVLLSIIFYKQIKAQKREFILLEEKKKAEKEIYQLFQDQQLEMLRAREREQNRIAKELHDGVMNQIYGVRLNLGMLNSFDEEDIKEKRLYFIEMLQKIEGEIREISHDLHGENKFEKIDFKSILEELTHSQNNLSITKFESEIEPTIAWDTISSIIKINIYRITQELFQNTLKYAKATKCTFKIMQMNNELQVIVTDNGVGFDLNEVKDGIGYKNINERIASINGTIKVTSELDKGTEILVKVLI